MNGKKKIIQPAKPESSKTQKNLEAEAYQKIETERILSFFRPNKILSLEKDSANNIYIRASKKIDENQKQTIPFKLTHAEAALLAIRLLRIVEEK